MPLCINSVSNASRITRVSSVVSLSSSSKLNGGAIPSLMVYFCSFVFVDDRII